MKLSVEIGIVYNDFGKRSIIEEFRELFPFGKYHAGFRVQLPPDDPRVEAVLDAFQKRAIPKVNHSIRPKPPIEYTFESRRQYDQGDFDNSDYLQLKPEVFVSDESSRDDRGRLVLEAWHLMPALRMGCVLFNATVVSDEIRRRMESERLVGIAFKELVLTPSAETRTLADEKGHIFREVTPGEQNHIEKQGRYWELTSSVILPPMPPDRVVRHFPDDDVHVAGIRDGEYFDKEIHYPTSAIRKLEPFDFALTHEIFGAKSWQEFPGERWPIVSQRFRQFCLAQKLKVSWIPVRLE